MADCDPLVEGFLRHRVSWTDTFMEQLRVDIS
jgi:hypothetical protein